MKQTLYKSPLTSVSALAMVILASGSLSSISMAQGKKPRLVLEEVLVTATKTEALASDVAISANVMTTKELENIGANDMTEIAKIAPGLDFASSQDAVSGAIKLRNVGSDSFEGGNDKAVATFILNSGLHNSLHNIIAHNV